MRFVEDPTLQPLEGRLVYRLDERSIDFGGYDTKTAGERAGDGGTTSLTIGTLQIEVGVDSGILLFIWGYYPIESWKRDKLPAIKARSSGLKVEVANETNSELPGLERGISLTIAEINEWPTVYDTESGWLYVGNPPPRDASDSIEFARNTIAVIEGGVLKALVLHPEME